MHIFPAQFAWRDAEHCVIVYPKCFMIGASYHVMRELVLFRYQDYSRL